MVDLLAIALAIKPCVKVWCCGYLINRCCFDLLWLLLYDMFTVLHGEMMGNLLWGCSSCESNGKLLKKQSDVKYCGAITIASHPTVGHFIKPNGTWNASLIT